MAARGWRRTSLWFITPGDRDAQATLDLVRAAVAGGVGTVLLRERQLAPPVLLALARDVRRVTQASEAALLLHTDIELALRVGADGVHGGWDGPGVADMRRRAPGLLASRSCHWPVAVEDLAADVILLSPFRETPRSAPRPLLLRQHVLELLAGAGIPKVIALGGLEVQDVATLPAGLSGIAAIRAIADSPDPRAAAAGLRTALEQRRDARTDTLR